MDSTLRNTATFARLLQTCGRNKSLFTGKLLHSRLIRADYEPSIFIINHLLGMYSKCGQLGYALYLFDQMPHKNLISYTTIISGFSQTAHPSESLYIFREMLIAGENLTDFALSSVILAAASLGYIIFAKQVHSLATKTGLSGDLYVGSNLADMYSRLGFLSEACLVFEEMPWKDEVSWTTMMVGYTKNGNNEEALISFRNLIRDEMMGFDEHVLNSALSACSNVEAFGFGKCVHSIIVKSGFESATQVGNALTDLYSKSGNMESALKVFSIDINIVSFTSLIHGYVSMGEIEAAMHLFISLLRRGLRPNQFTFSSLVKSCASHGALEQGALLHSQAIKTNFDRDEFVSSAIVAMYGKCGLVDRSLRAFREITDPSDIACNSLIRVYAQHGLGSHALGFFDEMVSKTSMKPNSATFVSLLMGCSHARLVEEGLRCFRSMDTVHGVRPREEHYTCVVDLLCRANRLEQAEDFIRRMPFEANALCWSSLLNACRIRGDESRGKIAAENLLRLEPENGGARVRLSNIYATGGHWEGVRDMRKMMKDSNVKKTAGISWVDVGNKTHVFKSQDSSHPRRKEIYEELDRLLGEIKTLGYVARVDLVPFEVDDAAKERLLHRHSERMAIAFALIGTPMGKPIIVKKNIRVCEDCHSAIKCISKAARRMIIVRDNTRFHHFADGLCSCGDYW